MSDEIYAPIKGWVVFFMYQHYIPCKSILRPIEYNVCDSGLKFQSFVRWFYHRQSPDTPLISGNMFDLVEIQTAYRLGAASIPWFQVLITYIR